MAFIKSRSQYFTHYIIPKNAGKSNKETERNGGIVDVKPEAMGGIYILKPLIGFNVANENHSVDWSMEIPNHRSTFSFLKLA